MFTIIGVYKFSSGDVYDGEFKNGLFDGEGNIIWLKVRNDAL